MEFLPCTAAEDLVRLCLDPHGAAGEQGRAGCGVRVGAAVEGCRARERRRVWRQPRAVRGLHYAQHVSSTRGVSWTDAQHCPGKRWRDGEEREREGFRLFMFSESPFAAGSELLEPSFRLELTSNYTLLATAGCI